MVTLDDLISPDEFVELRTNHSISNERIEYLCSHTVLTVLVDNKFNASHVPALIVGDGWKDKLEWIASNYEGILKPMGFKPTHVARIVRGRDWKDKLYWVEKYSGEASYTPSQIASLMPKKNWKQIVGYSK